MKYVVDTCIINKLADETLSLDQLPSDGEYVVSHVQIDELKKTKSNARRAQLLATFSSVVDLVAPTESLVVGISVIGAAKLSDGKDYTALKASLDALNKSKSNNANDILIAEVALKNGFTLITSDKALSEAAAKHGCKVLYVET